MRATQLIGGLSALAVIFASVPANAEILKNFRLSGQIDVQATSANNATDLATSASNVGAGAPHVALGNNDRLGDVQTRTMVHLDWDLLDDVHSKITLTKNDRTWGTNGNNPVFNPNQSAHSQTITSGGGTAVLDNIYIDQANFKVDKIAGQVDLTMGRQFYGDSGDIVAYWGPSDKAWYGLPVDSLDAARLDWMPAEWFAATGVAGKQKGSNVGTTGAADVDVRGLTLKANLADWFSNSLYMWNKLTHGTGALGSNPGDNPSTAGGKNDNLYLVGYRMKLNGMGFWLKGEFDQNFGDNRGAATPNTQPAAHYEGWATSGNVGWRGESDNAGMLSFWGEGDIGSGRQNSRSNVNDGFAAINPDFRPGSVWGRFASNNAFAGLGSNVAGVALEPGNTTVGDNNSLSNRVIWGGGIKMSPAVANKLVVGVSYWDYRIHRWNQSPAQNGPNAYPFHGNSHLGSEIDVDLTWAHSENVAFAAGWGNFQPGGLFYEAVALYNNGGNPAATAQQNQGINPVNLVYFDTRIKF